MSPPYLIYNIVKVRKYLMRLEEVIDLYLKRCDSDNLKVSSSEDVEYVRDVASRISSTCETMVTWGMLNSEFDEVEIGRWKK